MVVYGDDNRFAVVTYSGGKIPWMIHHEVVVNINARWGHIGLGNGVSTAIAIGKKVHGAVVCDAFAIVHYDEPWHFTSDLFTCIGDAGAPAGVSAGELR